MRAREEWQEIKVSACLHAASHFRIFIPQLVCLSICTFSHNFRSLNEIFLKACIFEMLHDFGSDLTSGAEF